MAVSWIILFCGLGLAAAKLTGETVTDVDEGRDWDILTINEAAGLDLLEGDIEQDDALGNTIIGDKYRWPTTIPYYLEDSLEMNAKGVILKAFDQYRLKTCIDFTPWKREENYISVYKGKGCSSFVGNQRKGKQLLSIGKNCDSVGIVEHEFLHALGFWHEQSRADRDDYVNIIWKNIQSDHRHNFDKYNDTETSALGVPYDYGSVMHYSKTAFSRNSEPTIVTKIPQFRDVIGQMIGLSAGDLTKLNRLYNCTKSSTFVDSCDFEEENICGMIQGTGKAKWERLTCARGGPQTDFSNMGQCKGKGYFMHFSTASAKCGAHAFLESRWLYPKPGAQCLQFFLYNSGADDDVLNIHVRQYDKANPCGKLKLVMRIPGGVKRSWELHNINLNMTQKARVVFEGVRGKKRSKGGFSLDDINLSSTKCPQHTWPINNIKHLLANTSAGHQMFSPRFLSPAGYSFQVSVYINGVRGQPGYLATYLHLTSGPNDDKLKWPCPWQQATIALMDQQSDIRQQMNMHHMVTTDPNKKSSDGTEYYWDNPKKVGSKVNESNDCFYYRGPGWGTSMFISHSTLKSRNFIKGDTALFLLSLEDISDLLVSQPLPRSAVQADADMMTLRMWRRRRQQKIEKVAIIQDMS